MIVGAAARADSFRVAEATTSAASESTSEYDLCLDTNGGAMYKGGAPGRSSKLQTAG